MRKPANESSQPYGQDLPGICAVQEERCSRRRAVEGACGKLMGTCRDPEPCPRSTLCYHHQDLNESVHQSLTCPCLPLLSYRSRSHLCWFSISEEVPSERMQQWFVAKILRGVNVGHDARETGFPTVCGKNGPSLRNRIAIHRGCLLQHAVDLIMVIFLFHCMPGKGTQ